MACMKAISTFNLGMNADSVEWCPIEGFRDLLVCGTYQLDSNSGERIGELHLIQLGKHPDLINIVQKINMPGVLDCKWAHVKLDSIYLAVVNAVGEIRLYILLEEKKLKEVFIKKLTKDDDTLLLSLDWSTGVHTSDAHIVTSDSKGFIHLLNFDSGNINIVDSWSLHKFEAWISAFNYWNTNIFFTGGDDCLLKCFDKRIGSKVFSSNAHNAGVTAVQYNFKDEHSFASGSYDENILFWDFRHWKVPKGSVTPGGGVWRLKWEPSTCKTVATCCMYEGSYIVDPEEFTTIVDYHEHKSINYGIDWCYLDEKTCLETISESAQDGKKIGLLAVCSFYDQHISLATFSNDIK
ncbi:diphthine methyltransferase isoform X2 [Cimex lectularius]|uniref:methylated diphthine methylhydrolase n=1 Tax=Cimex lectularius TaxID=79782 RepID=A0A8I6TL35_CIMLE|nr:diphthine methyltransferase isoform X2 [Cimex lectularius]